jgi:hypothetical protein
VEHGIHGVKNFLSATGNVFALYSFHNIKLCKELVKSSCMPQGLKHILISGIKTEVGCDMEVGKHRHSQACAVEP